MASSLLVSNSLSSSSFFLTYVFAPTISSSSRHFLLSKIQNPDVKFEEIHDLDDIYKYTPEILASLYEKKRAKEWYFFSPRIMKHENGSRPNRKVAGQSSFWRASNGGKMMVQVHNRQFLGHKGALNYFKNKQSKTNWIMQEYTLASQNHHGPHKIIHREVPFIATDDNDCGNSSNFGLSNIEPHHADPEEARAIIQDYQEKYQCDFNTDHPDVVAPTNVESTRGFRGRGPRSLRDFPNFNLLDLEFDDWEANAWDNEFAPV
ncbi:hypothetical protein Syun_015037 [Stephania yunnanensis]|uniref:NAC domain-containing protein n=1 Tax=Stephania yunnanensis TaxID=152371 RepID=A0AAP0JMR0_9MAGN